MLGAQSALPWATSLGSPGEQNQKEPQLSPSQLVGHVPCRSDRSILPPAVAFAGTWCDRGVGKPGCLGIHGGRELRVSAPGGGSRLCGGDREASGLGCGAEGPGDPQTKAQDDKSSEV